MSDTWHARPANTATARRHQQGSKRSNGAKPKRSRRLRAAGNHGAMNFMRYAPAAQAWNPRGIAPGQVIWSTVLSVDDWNRVTVALGGGVTGVLVAVARSEDTRLSIEVGDRIRVRVLSVNTEERTVRLQYLARSLDLTAVDPAKRSLRVALGERLALPSASVLALPPAPPRPEPTITGEGDSIAQPARLGDDDVSSEARPPMPPPASLAKAAIQHVDRSQIGDLLDFRRRSMPDALRLLSLIGDASKRHDVAIQRRTAALRGSDLSTARVVREARTARAGQARAADLIAHFTESERLWPSDVSFVLVRFVSRMNDVLSTTELPILKRYARAGLIGTGGADAARGAAFWAVDYCTHVALPRVLEDHGFGAQADRLRALPALNPDTYHQFIRVLSKVRLATVEFLTENLAGAEQALRESREGDAIELYAIAATALVDLAQEFPRSVHSAALVECLDGVVAAAHRRPFVRDVAAVVATAAPAPSAPLPDAVRAAREEIQSGGSTKSDAGVFSATIKAAFAALAQRAPVTTADFMGLVEQWRRIDGAVRVSQHAIDRIRERAPICASLEDDQIVKMAVDVVRHGALDDHWAEGEKRVWGAFVGVDLCLVVAPDTDRNNVPIRGRVYVPTVMTAEMIEETEARQEQRLARKGRAA